MGGRGLVLTGFNYGCSVWGHMVLNALFLLYIIWLSGRRRGVDSREVRRAGSRGNALYILCDCRLLQLGVLDKEASVVWV